MDIFVHINGDFDVEEYFILAEIIDAEYQIYIPVKFHNCKMVR